MAKFLRENRRIIFYHPKPIGINLERGSAIRPFKLLEAFRELGYEVSEVVGFTNERKVAIERVTEFVRSGGKYAFAYAESANIPLALAHQNRIPLHPFLDYSFFRLLNERKIPLGLFYRDIFWKFSCFKGMLPWHQRVLSVPFYKMDWLIVRKYVQHLFLPSLAMNLVLPDRWVTPHYSALPAGVDDKISIELMRTIPRDGLIQLLYVGGIKPPVYDLRQTLMEISKNPRLRLTLCCRESEWNELQSVYRPIINNNIQVCHKHGSDLIGLYRRAQFFLLVLAPYEYLRFAMPVKLMESMTHGVPIIANGGTEYANFISNNEVGWLVDRPADIAELISKLHRDPIDYSRKIQNIRSVKETNTWAYRAKKIAGTLMTYLITS